jgi:hypothetical protein
MQLVRCNGEHKAYKQEKRSNFMPTVAPFKAHGGANLRLTNFEGILPLGRFRLYEEDGRDWYALESAAWTIQANWRGAVTYPECTHDLVDMAAPRCPQMSAPAPDCAQDPELLSMHYGRTGTISASGGAGYPDRLSMLYSAQKAWSVPLQPHDPELVARPFGSSSVHQGHGLSQIQTAWRFKALSSKYKQYCVARSIQASWRREVRQRAFTDFIAARRLQARWRAISQRKAFERYKAARCLQTWREVLHRGVHQKYLTACNTGFEENIAATTLQTALRAKHNGISKQDQSSHEDSGSLA